jgi:long-chain acyl-CoA synthetase
VPDQVATEIAPPGLSRSLDYPEVPIGAILLGAARRWPDRVGWIDEAAGRQMTYAEAAAGAA